MIVDVDKLKTRFGEQVAASLIRSKPDPADERVFPELRASHPASDPSERVFEQAARALRPLPGCL